MTPFLIFGFLVVFVVSLFTLVFKYRKIGFFVSILLSNLGLVIIKVPTGTILVISVAMFIVSYIYCLVEQKKFAAAYEAQESEKVPKSKGEEKKKPAKMKAGLKYLLDDFSDVLAKIETHQELRDQILEEIGKIKEVYNSPLLVCVLGEWSSGKSSFINALLGEDLLATTDIETTATITRLQYSEHEFFKVHFKDGKIETNELNESNKRYIEKFYVDYTEDQSILEKTDLVTVSLNNGFLREFDLADTPGYNSDNNRHTELTDRYSRCADAIIWLFTADQFGKASEVKKLSEVSKYFKPIFVINKIDLVKLKDGETYQQKFESKIEKLTGLYDSIFYTSSKRDNGMDYTVGLKEVKEYLLTKLAPNSKQIKESSIVIKLFELGGMIEELRCSIQRKKESLDVEYDKITVLIKEWEEMSDKWTMIIKNWDGDLIKDTITFLENYKERYFLIQSPSKKFDREIDEFLDEMYQLNIEQKRVEATWEQLIRSKQNLNQVSSHIQRRVNEYDDKFFKSFWDSIVGESIQSDERRKLNRDIEDYNSRIAGLNQEIAATKQRTNEFNDQYSKTHDQAVDFINSKMASEINKQLLFIEKKEQQINKMIEKYEPTEIEYNRYLSELEIINNDIRQLFIRAHNSITDDSTGLLTNEIDKDFDKFIKAIASSLDSKRKLDWDRIYTRAKTEVAHDSSKRTKQVIPDFGQVQESTNRYNTVR